MPLFSPSSSNIISKTLKYVNKPPYGGFFMPIRLEKYIGVLNEKWIWISSGTESLKSYPDSMSIRKNRLKRLFQHFRKASQDKLFSTYNSRWDLISDIICLRMNAIYILLLIYSISLSYWICRRKIFAWFSVLILLLGAGHLFVILYSCQNVWYRLIIPFTPVYLLMIGQLINLLDFKGIHKQWFI